MQHRDLPRRQAGGASPQLSPVDAFEYLAPSPRPRRPWSLRRVTATAITAIALAGTGGVAFSAAQDTGLGAAPAVPSALAPPLPQEAQASAPHAATDVTRAPQGEGGEGSHDS